METHKVSQKMHEGLIAPIMQEERRNIHKGYILTLTRARDRIAQPGMWFKGDFGPDPYIWAAENDNKPIEEAPYCALGTLNWAASGDAYAMTAYAEELAILMGGVYFNEKEIDAISNFNDSPDTQQDDVVAAFDYTIEWLKENLPS